MMHTNPNMKASEVIYEIEAMPEEEKGKVIDFLHNLEAQRFEEEQVRVAEKRLEDYENGIEEAIPHEEAMRRLREG